MELVPSEDLQRGIRNFMMAFRAYDLRGVKMKSASLDTSDTAVLMAALFYWHFDSGRSGMSTDEIDQLFRKLCDLASMLTYPAT
jgi:hypothetical protein